MKKQIRPAKRRTLEHIEHSELISLDVDAVGVSSLAGKYSADPTLREICDEAYQRRDAESHP